MPRNLPLPRWAYVPGETAEAEADHETLAQAKCWCRRAFRGYVPARHPALRYGIVLNDRGYFWESQEILEAVWAAAPQGGRERILLRACIQIANGNLRLRMDKPDSAARPVPRGAGGVAMPRRARRPAPATALPTAFRATRWPRSSRPHWQSRR